MKSTLFAILLFLFGANAAHSVVLNVDLSGQLTGASGVDVGGVLYDVSFREGSCNELFGGCDSNSDFPFADPATVLQASQALLDQVFVDGPQGNFDSSPELTSGCSLALFCFVITPFEIAPGGPGISFVSLVRNRDDTSISITDGIARTEWLSALSTSGDDRVVYATWEATVIPVPAAGLLLITAFGGMVAFQRYSRSKNPH